MSAPVILSPVAPIHHDIVDRNISLTETLESLDHLCGCLVAFTALPVSHRPLRHDLSLSCQCAVAADHLIHIVAGDEIPIHLLAHLAPPRMLCLLYRINNIIYAETAIRNASVRSPINAYRSLLPCLETYCELVCIRIPSCSPTLRNNNLTTYCYSSITSIIEDELIISCCRSLDEALILHLRTEELEILRKIDNLFHCRSHEMLEIKLRFLTYQCLTISWSVCTCQDTLLAIF